MPHDHHDHATTFQPDIKEPTQEWEFLEIALRELLIDKGIVTAREIADMVEAWEQKTPENGAKIIAKAWVDSDFKARLLDDGNAAVAELGFVIEGTKLVALENTADLHHMVVCTLCSCYPRPILGMPPLWYKSKEYRARAVREPRAVLAEFGTELGDGCQVRVLDSTADIRYLVIPKRPDGTDEMNEPDLAELVTRDSMIGTATAKQPNGERASA
jgi:nitrile hydratase subunit alpha